MGADSRSVVGRGKRGPVGLASVDLALRERPDSGGDRSASDEQQTITAAPARIKRAQSLATDTRQAAREFCTGVTQPGMALVVFFCSNEYDLGVLAEEFGRLLAGVQVVGCTTAGEIGPSGYREHSLTGASFPAEGFQVVSGRLDHLREFKPAAGDALAETLLQDLESRTAPGYQGNSFALLLIDGLSMREEVVTRALQNKLGEVPLIGGSAGDGLRFGSTHVYSEGRFHSDSAILVLATTRLPIRLFKTQHFVPMDERVVVTDADPDLRLVREINGLPAAEEYARITGIGLGDLDPMRFAAWPVVVMLDGTSYVRSIQKANADGSLTFYCAIEAGVVLRVAKGVDLLGNLEEAFSRVRKEIGPPQFVLGCDCILRKLEVSRGALETRVGQTFAQNNTVGFNSYGEQYQGLHINQTFVGLAIGSGQEDGAHGQPG